ncbi:MAG: ABC transporter substrate-binding protein, partial [Chloroflexi bacterium]|nr:ABC transporter substrate-binding protein [Chloroflexota bacterium]
MNLWKIGLALLVGVAFLGGCAGAQPTATATKPPVAVQTPTQAPTATPTKRPLVKASMNIAALLSHPVSNYALAKGLFRDEGLDLEVFNQQSGATIVAALASGDMDLVTISADSVITGIAAGTPLVIVNQLHPQVIAVTMRKDVADRLGVSGKSPLEARARALKGLTIAVSSPTGAVGRVAKTLLRVGGLDPDRDAEFTQMKDADAVSAMKANRMDVMSMSVPYPFVPAAEGFGEIIFTSGQESLPGYSPSYTVISTNRDTATKRPEVVEAATRAHWRALRLIKANLGEAAQVFKQMDAFRDLDTQVLRLSLEATSFSDDPTVTSVSIQNAVANLNAERPPDQQISVTFDQVATNRFVEAAKK